MKTHVIFIKAAGWICVLFVAFHLAFYSLFNWENSLSCLTQSDRAILLTYHAISILILAFMAFVPIFQAKDLLQSKLKYTVLSMFSIFYLIRIIAEFAYFGVSPATPVILIMCAVPMILFAAPIFMKKI